MRFLLLLGLFLLIGYFLRSKRSGPVRTAAPTVQTTQAATSTMVACAHCGVHLPCEEAIPGRDGAYCSEAHRKLQER
jgi:uncharacterized protein